MNKTTFLQTLAGHLSTLQGKMSVQGDVIWLDPLTGDISHLLKWLDGIAFSRRYTITEAKLVCDALFQIYWQCNGGMSYTVKLEEGITLHIELCEIQKTLPQGNLNISVDL